MIEIYGIKNCDTVRKARRWLDEAKVDYRFHDFREDGLETDVVATWLDTLGHDVLVNKRSTTWKQLDDREREQAVGDGAAALLTEHPTLIKRPVLIVNDQLHVGFSAPRYADIFA